MHLRSGLDKSSKRKSRSQPAQAPNLSMDEYHFTEFDSNGADVGSSRQNGSPSRPETQNHEITNEQHAQDIVLSSQYEGHQETPIASSYHTQRPCSAPPSFDDPALYSEASVPVLYPTTSASFLQPYPTTTTSQPQPQLQLQHNYPSYMPSHINAPQPESIYTYDASPLPSPPPPPPPAAPTPPPLPPHLRRSQPPSYNPQAQNQYHTPLTQHQTHQFPSVRPNIPPLLTHQTQVQTQQQPRHQFEDDPWSPLSARETRKRRASNALSNAALGVSGADVDREHKDKMGRELDSLEMESRSARIREGNGEGSSRNSDLGGRRRRRKLNNGNADDGSAGRRRRRRDEDENENEVEYEARMEQGEEEDSDRGNGHAYS